MTDFIADSQGNAYNPRSLPVPQSAGGPLVQADLNEYRTDRIFTAQPVNEEDATMKATDTTASSTTESKPASADKPQGGPAAADKTKDAAAPGGNGGDGGGKKKEDPKPADAGNGGGGKGGGGTPSPNTLSQGGFGNFGKLIGIGCLAIAALVVLGFVASWMVRKNVPQEVANAVNTVANATTPSPTPSGTAVARAQPFVGPLQSGYQRVFFQDGDKTYSVESNDVAVVAQGISASKEVAMTYANVTHLPAVEEMRRNLAVTTAGMDLQAKRLQEAELKLAAQQAELDRKMGKDQTVLVVQPVAPTYRQVQSSTTPVGYRTYRSSY